MTDIEEILSDAQAGNADAQYEIGYRYYYGEGLEQDYSIAYKWFEKAAEQGIEEAIEILGEMYICEFGGITLDNVRALQWYLKSMENSDPPSQTKIGTYFYDGEWFPQDYAKAIEWYEKAAIQDYAPAQFFLGRMYYIGTGINRDLEKGAEYFLEAAKNGYLLAQIFVGKIYYYGEGMNKDNIKAYAWSKLTAPWWLSFSKRQRLSKLAASEMNPEELKIAKELACKYKDIYGTTGIIKLLKAAFSLVR